MRASLIYSLFVVLAATICVGIVRYRQLDTAMRIVVGYVCAQLASELFLYISAELKLYELRYIFMNIYMVIDVMIIMFFFIYAIKPHYYKELIIVNTIAWPTIEGINMLLFQQANNLNSNFVILESFGIISLSLYYVYWLLKNDVVQNVFTYPHFWITIVWLLIWSLSLFFWGVVMILFNSHWQHINITMHVQAALNIIAHAGIAFVLYFYPKRTLKPN